MLAFESRFAVEGDDVRPVDGAGTDTRRFGANRPTVGDQTLFPNGIVADVAEFFGVVRVVAEAGVEEVALEAKTISRRQEMFELRNHVR